MRCIYKSYKLASDSFFYFYSPSLQCSSFSVHPFTVCVSWGFVFLVLLYTFFLGDFLPSLRDNYHVYMDGYLIRISSSRTSDPYIYCWVFHSYILQYLKFGCAQMSHHHPFLTALPPAHRQHPQHSLPLVVLRASGYLHLSPRYPSPRVASIPVQSTIT